MQLDSQTLTPPSWHSPIPTLPNVVMLLDVDLVEHHVFFFCVDVFFHLHGNVLGQHRQQQPLLDQWFHRALLSSLPHILIFLILPHSQSPPTSLW